MHRLRSRVTVNSFAVFPPWPARHDSPRFSRKKTRCAWVRNQALAVNGMCHRWHTYRPQRPLVTGFDVSRRLRDSEGNPTTHGIRDALRHLCAVRLPLAVAIFEVPGRSVAIAGSQATSPGLVTKDGPSPCHHESSSAGLSCNRALSSGAGYELGRLRDTCS